jgi:integrase
MSKRGNGEGSIYPHGTGRWAAAVTYVDETGVRRRTTLYGKTQKEARAKRDEALRRAREGLAPTDAKISVRDYTTRWVSVGLKAGSQKDSTKALYATLARVHILPSALGSLGLGQVKPSDVQGFILALRGGGKAESTVRQIYTVLRAVFESALADGLVARNVVAGVKRPSVTRRETHSLTPSEVADLLEQTDKTSYGLMIRLMAYTGLRRGEAVALRWEDVDLDSKTVNVRGTINRVAGVGLVTTLPKTMQSRRTVYLADQLVGALRRHKIAQSAERRRLGPLWEERGLVFTTSGGSGGRVSGGKPVDPRNVLRAVKEGARAAGLNEEAAVNVHTLRHSAASAMLVGGVPLLTVSRMLGHSSVSITGDIYGHITDDGGRQAAATLANALEKPSEPGGRTATGTATGSENTP